MGETDAELILSRYSTPAQKQRSPGAALISSSIMLGYEQLVRELHGNPAQLLDSVGLDPALSCNPFEQMEFAAFALLLERTSQALNCPDFGLRLGLQQSGLVVMGPVGLALERVDTIGDMFRYCSKLMHIYSTGIQIHLEKNFCDSETMLTFECLAADTPFRRQIMEQLLLIGNKAAIDLSSGRARAKEIWFTHASLAPRMQYEKIFGAKVVFSEICNAAIFDSRDIDAPVRTSDRAVFEDMLGMLSAHISEGVNVATQVKRELSRRVLDNAYCTRDEVAELLGIHPRTLHRRLREEGLSFEAIKDQTRRERAQHYLLESTLPLTEVAARLGFAEPAVLTRACQRWFGRTPSAMRRGG